jgi:hypothetical protein
MKRDDMKRRDNTPFLRWHSLGCRLSVNQVFLMIACLAFFACNQKPATNEYRLFIAHQVGDEFSVDELKCESYPAESGRGRASCNGALRLKQDLFSEGWLSGELERVGLKSCEMEFLFGHHLPTSVAVTTRVGTVVPLRADLLYEKQVDGYALEGMVSFEHPQGKPRTEFPEGALEQGSQQAKAIIENAISRRNTIVARRQEIMNLVTDFFAKNAIVEGRYGGYQQAEQASISSPHTYKLSEFQDISWGVPLYTCFSQSFSVLASIGWNGPPQSMTCSGHISGAHGKVLVSGVVQQEEQGEQAPFVALVKVIGPEPDGDFVTCGHSDARWDGRMFKGLPSSSWALRRGDDLSKVNSGGEKL